jgi:hypothetical protein
MPTSQLDSVINFLVPIILIIIAVVFVWWKFSEPLKKFGRLIAGLFSSGKDRAADTYQSSKEIIYDI